MFGFLLLDGVTVDHPCEILDLFGENIDNLGGQEIIQVLFRLTHTIFTFSYVRYQKTQPILHG